MLTCSIIAVLTAGCSAPGEDKSDDPSATQAGPVEAPTSGPAVRPPDPVAPASIAPVVRDGAAPQNRLKVGEQKSTDQAVYSDQVAVSITGMKSVTTSGHGPGVISGAHMLEVTVSVRNGLSKPLNLSSVVVNARHGSPERSAQPSYNGSTTDLSGQVAPGATAKAVYGFLVPADAGDRIRVVVDLDNAHAPAVFRGRRS